VTYYNDSFASGVGATLAAVESIKQPKIMLIGGFDRGLSLSELAQAMLEHSTSIRKVILFGQSGKRVSEEFDEAGFTNFILNTSQKMEDIVNEARDHAKKGDAVVLSPAFASFDMFKNFEDRGNNFNAAVDKLK
jgi:UDP-N-acetylmuramoylalanine--D-glutamate ligase